MDKIFSVGYILFREENFPVLVCFAYEFLKPLWKSFSLRKNLLLVLDDEVCILYPLSILCFLWKKIESFTLDVNQFARITGCL